MPAQYNSGTYEVYWYKEQNNTPNEPLSPTNEIGTSPRNKTNFLKVGAIAAAGVTVGRRAINTIRTEISETTGNERLQTGINNAMKLTGYAFMIAKGGLPGAILVGSDLAISAIKFNRELTRSNRAIRLESKLNGKRVNIAKGSAYYD